MKRARARIQVVAVLLVTALCVAPARGATPAQLIGALAGQACARMVASSASEASALLVDAQIQAIEARARYYEEADKGTKALARGGTDEEQVEIIARIELARRQAHAYRAARTAVEACYEVLAAKGPAYSSYTELEAKGYWAVDCWRSGDPKGADVVAGAQGSYRLHLLKGGYLWGVYKEEGATDGVVRGQWEKRAGSFTVQGSVSSNLGETSGTWNGTLKDGRTGGGAVRINKAQNDYVCAGTWWPS